jgi:hypothetical protein
VTGVEGENVLTTVFVCCLEQLELGTIRLLCNSGALRLPGDVGVEGRRGEGVRVDGLENLKNSLVLISKNIYKYSIQNFLC